MPTARPGTDEPNDNGQAQPDTQGMVDPNSTLHETIAANLLRSMDAYATQVSQSPASKSASNDTHVPITKTEAGFPCNIPGFIVERELGRGAFGVVYAARDEMLDRRVAIKMPIIDDPRHRQQYIDEARKAVKLDHPGIVPIYQVGKTSDSEPFVVQKLIDGTTLRNILQSNAGKLSLGDTVAMMRQVCLAVDAAHSAGIVHRDLKPENLLIEPDGRLYVADFGLAILEDDEAGGKKQEVAGTPLYMSPEQFLGRTEWLDGRSDIWALGVILYELLTGKPPFLGKSLSELKEQIRHHEPAPIHQLVPEIPAGFDAVFRKCCAKKTADRYGSMRELLKALSTLCESLPYLETTAWTASGLFDGFSGSTARLGTTNVVGTTRSAPAASATSRGRFTGWQGIAVSIIAIVGVLVGVVWYSGSKPSGDPMGATRVAESGLPNHGTANDSPQPPGGADSLSPSSNHVDPKQAKEPPVKPFRVSVDGSGTHDSIAQAIADSTADETITILAGTYRESLKLDRSIKLLGDGTVHIIAPEGNGLTVQGDSQVVVENVRLECKSPAGHAAEVVAGRLQLNQCVLIAGAVRAADCLRLHANALLEADHAEFRGTDHALIHADKHSKLMVRKSKFGFLGDRDASGQRCGIRADGAEGHIADCQFTGPCAVGIEWKNASAGKVRIEQSRFENCKTGILAESCISVEVVGSLEHPVEVKQAHVGLMFVQSHAELTNVIVDGVAGKSKAGLQMSEQSTVQCTSADFRGFLCGSLIESSALKATHLGTSDTSFAGVLSVNGTIDAESMHFKKARGFGLAILGGSESAKLGTLTVETFDADRTTSAVYAMSGRVEIGEVIGKQCLCALFIDPDRRVIETYEVAGKSLVAELVKLPKATESNPPVIRVERIELTDSSHSVFFAGAGECRWSLLEGNLEKANRVPFVPERDKLIMEGSEEKGFVVRSRLRR